MGTPSALSTSCGPSRGPLRVPKSSWKGLGASMGGIRVVGGFPDREKVRFRLPEGLQLDLITKFCAASLLPIIAIGVVITFFLNDLIDQRAFGEAKRSARLVAEVAVVQLLAGEDLSDGIDVAKRRTLATAIDDGRLADVSVKKLQIWGPGNRLLFTSAERSSEPSLFELVGIEEALAGETRPVREENHELTVFTPLQTG